MMLLLLLVVLVLVLLSIRCSHCSRRVKFCDVVIVVVGVGVSSMFTLFQRSKSYDAVVGVVGAGVAVFDVFSLF